MGCKVVDLVSVTKPDPALYTKMRHVLGDGSVKFCSASPREEGRKPATRGLFFFKALCAHAYCSLGVFR